MMIIVLLGVVVLAVGGCVCVVWADRGGPRWARVVASVTIGVSDLLRSSAKRNRKRRMLGGPSSGSTGSMGGDSGGGDS
ncbi:hypothetical protein OG897_20720 [Streptomyces sp. NBC_00237]|uniref:hypothetical protein n=1 Tax=Streptomyces sp. NBC_00237 TaxID=2975687 RepID=UPI00225474AD|nr:hypothetical protein [Streptomyces sp. NBC_00237]MCX5203868.1 hypothetical protein [Streptomyces sp. NBC_00237]